MSSVQANSVECWCGATSLAPFCDDYLHCERCETLINSRLISAADFEMNESDEGIYGRDYYTITLPGMYGFPPIEERARQDLTERCLHWLKAILQYRLPPASVLEIGSAHGAFVGLLQLAGYQATGLELSPWLVNFARSTFGIPMLAGPVEQQTIERGSLDVIAMMDVIEHLPRPLETIESCLELLKPDGLLMIQTPRYPPGMSYATMLETNDPFLAQLKPEQHLLLFSPPSISEFLRKLGVSHVRFETAVFSFYDMFLVACRKSLAKFDEAQISASLTESPHRRFALAMLDLRNREMDLRAALNDQTGNADLHRRIDEIEADRKARLKVILDQQGENAALRQRIDEIEADREARLKIILDQQGENAALRQRIDEIEADREARLKVILDEHGENAALRQRIDEIETDREARLKIILNQQVENAALRQRIDEIEADREARLKIILDQVEQSAQTIRELRSEIAGLRTFRGAARVLLKARRTA